MTTVEIMINLIAGTILTALLSITALVLRVRHDRRPGVVQAERLDRLSRMVAFLQAIRSLGATIRSDGVGEPETKWLDLHLVQIRAEYDELQQHHDDSESRAERPNRVIHSVARYLLALPMPTWWGRIAKFFFYITAPFVLTFILVQGFTHTNTTLEFVAQALFFGLPEVVLYLIAQRSYARADQTRGLSTGRPAQNV